MKVIHISNYYPPFKRSFIGHLENLADNLNLERGELVFCFPYSAENTNWMNELKKIIEFILLNTLHLKWLGKQI